MTRTLEPVRRSRLYEQVVERLRQHIDIEGLQPGDRLLSERTLSERLGVSRTSVRQALTVLEVKGLVEVRHGGGVFITHPPEAVLPLLANAIADEHEQLPAVIEVRQAIEAQTARLAALRRTEEDLGVLDAALAAMAAAIEAGEDSVAQADRAFHDGIVAAARNPLLSSLWQEVDAVVDRTRRASLARPGRPRASLRAHRRILDRIADGDPDRAAKAMLDHLEVVADIGFLATRRECDQ
jgi:GntR family transcriptional regulator, transcriptional repressor for pyruvate dehydrogenase complex